MIDAMAELCAEQGYEATKIADVVRRAHVARKTLYDNFSGKEDLFLAAFDTTLADAEAEVAEACEAIDPASGRRAPKPACGRCSSSSPPTPTPRGSPWSRRPPPARLRRPLRGGARRLHRPPARGGAAGPGTTGDAWRRRWSAGRSGSCSGRSAAGPRSTPRPAAGADRIRRFSVPECRKKVSHCSGANVTVRCHNSMIRWIACRVAAMVFPLSSSRAISAIG